MAKIFRESPIFDVYIATKSLHGADEYAVIYDPDTDYYRLDVVVCDGMGRSENAKISSSVAANELAVLLPTLFNSPNPLEDAKAAFYNVNKTVWDAQDIKYPDRGTTAVTASFRPAKDGSIDLYWANIGDSRIFAVTPEGRYESMSWEESFLSKPHSGPYNYLGKQDMKVDQIGHRKLTPGMFIVLVSDGITGGRPPLLDEELAACCKQDDPAFTLIKASMVNDDKTVVVVKVKDFYPVSAENKSALPVGAHFLFKICILGFNTVLF